MDGRGNAAALAESRRRNSPIACSHSHSALGLSWPHPAMARPSSRRITKPAPVERERPLDVLNE